MSWKAWVAAAALVAAVVVVGTWVTRFSLGEMALLAPIGVLAVGAVGFLVVLWAKVISESVRARRR